MGELVPKREFVKRAVTNFQSSVGVNEAPMVRTPDIKPQARAFSLEPRRVPEARHLLGELTHLHERRLTSFYAFSGLMREVRVNPEAVADLIENIRFIADSNFAQSPLASDVDYQILTTSASDSERYRRVKPLLSSGFGLANRETYSSAAKIHIIRDSAQKLRLLGEYTGLSEFIQSGELDVKVNGISMLDILKKQSLNPGDVFSYLTELSLAGSYRFYQDRVIGYADDPLSRQYPNMLMTNIIKGSQLVIAANWPDQRAFGHLRESADENTKKEIECSERIQKGIKLHVGKFSRILLSPGSREFVSLKTAMEPFMGQGEKVRKVAILSLGIFEDAGKLRQVFHQAYRYAKEGINTAFYNSLIEGIGEMFYEFGLATDILTIEDLRLALEGNPSFTVPTKQELGELVTDITSSRKTSDVEFKIDNLDTFREFGLIPPDEAVIAFDPYNPRRKVSLKTKYTSDLGETVEFTFDFNTHKDARALMDWEVFEPPEMVPDIANRFIAVMGSALGDIRDKALAEKSAKVSKPQIPVHPGPSRKLKTTAVDLPPAPKIKVKTRPEVSVDPLIAMEEVAEPDPGTERAKKYDIRPPEGKTLEDFTEDYPPAVRRSIGERLPYIRHISKMERAVGGEARYKGRIPVEGFRNGLRVIFRLVNGVYEIVNIPKRAIAYDNKRML